MDENELHFQAFWISQTLTYTVQCGFFFLYGNSFGFYSKRDILNVYYGRYNKIGPLDVVKKFLSSGVTTLESPGKTDSFVS